jgi:hypothetical protein
MNRGFNDKLILAYHLDDSIIRMMTSMLVSRKIKAGYEKHKSVGSVIKRRDTKKETVFGSVNSELKFWNDCNKMKNSIDLIDVSDIENLTQEEVREIFDKHCRQINCVLNFNNYQNGEKSQFLRVIRK